MKEQENGEGRLGGGYMFCHRMLMEYFAQPDA
jgi:hypothetical protein